MLLVEQIIDYSKNNSAKNSNRMLENAEFDIKGCVSSS
jgi:hypothetical protein